jgi:hypothetical protein
MMLQFSDLDIANVRRYFERDFIALGQVCLCYKRYGEDAPSCMRIQESYAPVFSHVELLFECIQESGSSVYRACTVDKYSAQKLNSGYVRFTDKDMNYAYPAARWVRQLLHTLDDTQKWGMLWYCKLQIGKPMNTFGLYWNFLLPWFRERTTIHSESLFCVQLVAGAMKWVGYRMNEPACMAPVDLYVYAKTQSAPKEVATIKSFVF